MTATSGCRYYRKIVIYDAEHFPSDRQGSGVFAADQIEGLLEAQGVEAAVRVLGPQLLGELGELGHDGHLPPEAVDLGPLPLLAHDLPHLQLVGVGGHVLVVGRPVVVGVRGGRCNRKRKRIRIPMGSGDTFRKQ